MKKVYSFVVTLLVGAASLTSCSRANYAFNNQVPAYLGTEQAHPVASQPATAPEVIVKAAPGTPVSTPIVAAQPQAVAAKMPASQPAKATRLSLAQRVVVKQLVKQLDKVKSRNQNTAHTEHTAASKAGRSALIALAGLALIFLGGAIGNGFGGLLVLIGLIAFLVGIVLVVVHLVSGD